MSLQATLSKPFCRLTFCRSQSLTCYAVCKKHKAGCMVRKIAVMTFVTVDYLTVKISLTKSNKLFWALIMWSNCSRTHCEMGQYILTSVHYHWIWNCARYFFLVDRFQNNFASCKRNDFSWSFNLLWYWPFESKTSYRKWEKYFSFNLENISL